LNRQIFLDTETTGISHKSGHRIIEVGCLEAIDRKLTNRQFHYYINPMREVDAGAFKVHGLSTKFLSDKPKFSEIAAELMEFIIGADLVIHNAPFDVGFLDFELAKLRKSYQPLAKCCGITDTLVMARKKHPGQKNNLDALCKRYNINNTHRELHGALLDAELLAQMYFRMTGGQKNLFDNVIVDDLAASHVQSTDAALSTPTSVLAQISKEEELLHDRYLASMRDDGKCDWLD